MGAVSVSELDSWFPFGIEWTPAGPMVNWFRLDAAGLSSANFSETVARCAGRPFNLVFRRKTSLETLADVAAQSRSLEPSGFVFHMSRCGSTLVSRMLQTRQDTLVISEAPPIDAILQANLRDSSVTDEQRITWLRWIVSVLGRRIDPAHHKYVIKLDAWHTRDIGLFERAFPGVPWVFVYRDPVEVLVSHMSVASYMMSAANAPAALGIPVTEAIQIPREEYCARVLSRIVDAIADRGPAPDALVDYGALPDAVWERICPRFGLGLTPDQVATMRRSAAYHAKQPQLPFSDDRAAKQQMATAAIRQAATTWLSPSVVRVRGLSQAGSKERGLG